MNTLELTDKKELLKKQAEELLSKAQSESRKLNDGETQELANIQKQIADTDEEIRKINEKLNETKETRKTMEQFSLLKAINDVANNRPLDERSQEVVNAGIAEMRKSGQNFSGQIVLPVEERATVQATVATAGKEDIAVDKLGILEPLKAKLVMVQAGASYMTGLSGNISIPVYSGSNVGWAGEVASATDGAGTFSEITLEPKRLTAYIDVSKQFLIQDSNSAEEMLKRDIVEAISQKLESTILGTGAGSATQPSGILNGVTADTKAITYEDIVKMEQTLEEANVSGDIKFIVSPSAKAILKTTKLDAGSGKFAMEGGEVNGYPVLSTSNVSGKGVVYGNFNDYVIGQWGGIDLTVDPYTQAANGKVRLVINAYFDAKPRRASAFVKKVLL